MASEAPVITNLGCSPKPKTPSVIELSMLIEEDHKANINTSPASTADPATTIAPTNAHKIIAELVGTYVIIFVGCGSWMIDKRYHLTIVGVAVSWGLVVMVMIYAFGHISGSNFNPAVTIAFATSRKFPWKLVPAYVIAQVAGSTLAELTLEMLFQNHVDIGVTVTQYLGPTTSSEAFAWEFILSFILMITVCGVATDSRAINELCGVTIGATFLFSVLLAGNITGASMNPARSIGAALVSMKFQCLWVYILAPILGTTSASLIYGLLWLPMPGNI